MQPATKYSTSAKLHSRTNKEGKRALYVTYTFAKKTTPFPTSFSVAESDWDGKRKLAIVGTTDAVAINNKIQQVQSDILAVAAKLAVPTHEMVKRLYGEQAYQQSKQELNKYLDLAIAVGEDWQIENAEEKLAGDQKQLEARKKAFAATRTQHGLESNEEREVAVAKQELANLWLRFAGTGEPIPGQVNANGKPRREQGTLKHYKPATYNSMVSMWNIVHEFAEYTGYTLTLQNINLDFYRRFGDFILFGRKVKDKNGNWTDSELSFDNHFGSIIKRLKTFLNWCASDGGASLNPEANSRKFKILEEENEVIILSDSTYKLLADFRSDPACNPSWVKHIDITLFQTSVGLRHSDMKKASWRIEGEIVDGKDRRTLVGTTQKNKSNYIIPIYLQPEWTLGILEKYDFDFNRADDASKKKGAKDLMNILMFNNTMQKALEALDKKHGIFKQRIKIYKKKWGEEYLVKNPNGKDYFHQYELHSSHDNRRAFITRMFRMKFSEKVIAKMVGTRSLGELRKYQQVADEDFFTD